MSHLPLLVDLTPYATNPNPTGIGVYSLNLMYHLLRLAPDLHPRPAVSLSRILSLKKYRRMRAALAEGLGYHGKIALFTDKQVGSWRLSHYPPFRVFHATDKFFPPPGSGPRVLTLHDLYVFHEDTGFPHVFHEKKQAQLRAMIASKPEAVVFSSHATQKDYHRFFDYRPPVSRVIHPTAAMEYVQHYLQYHAEGEETTPHVPDPWPQILGHSLPAYMLFIVGGGTGKLKNIARVLQAVHRIRTLLQETGMRLVILGSKDRAHFLAHLERIGARAPFDQIQDRVLLAPYIPRSLMPMVYAHARFLIQPSLREGFGLPVLEAMMCGTPSIVSRGTSLPEITGDAGIQIDPLQVEELEEALVRLIRDAALRADLSRKGLRRVPAFLPEAFVQRLRELYRSLTEQEKVPS